MTRRRPAGHPLTRRRRALGLLAVTLGLAGCGTSVTSLSYPAPPATPAASTTTVPPPFDGVGITEPTVAGEPTTTAIAAGPGNAAIAGTVEGPSGRAVAGATVEAQRLVGDAVATTEVLTSKSGGFRLSHVLGGRYRVRAWEAPTMAMTTPAVLFVGSRSSASLTLRMRSFAGPTVTSAFAPRRPVVGRPAAVAVEVSTPDVSATGIVDYQPDAGTTVELLGGWTVTGEATERTGALGVVTFVATCEAVGVHPLAVLVGSVTTAPLDTPRCKRAPTAPARTPTTPRLPRADA